MTAPNFSGPTSVVALVDGSGNPATGANSIPVQGNVASGATDAGNPLKVGMVYRATLPTLTDGQRVDAQADARGSLRVLNQGITTAGTDAYANTGFAGIGSTDQQGSARWGINGTLLFNGSTWDRMRGDTVAQSVLPGQSSTFWNYAAASGGIVNTTTAVTVKAAAGAGVRNYISSLDLEWDTLGAATEFAIRDGAAGTVIYRTKLNTAAGRKTVNFPVPLRGTANTLVEIVTLTATTTGGVFANLQGFTGA